MADYNLLHSVVAIFLYVELVRTGKQAHSAY